MIDITAPRGRDGHEGICLHRVRHLAPDDRATHDGIPTTSVARTLFDLAEVVDARRVERAFENAERLGLFDLKALERQVEHGRGRRALRVIVPLMGLSHPAGTRSELERDFLNLCLEAGLPAPQVNVIVEGFELDALWSERRLVVELDGFEFHGTRAAFERDRARDTKLQLAGYRVLRFTWRQLRDDPCGVADAVRALLVSSRSAP